MMASRWVLLLFDKQHQCCQEDDPGSTSQHHQTQEGGKGGTADRVVILKPSGETLGLRKVALPQSV